MADEEASAKEETEEVEGAEEAEGSGGKKKKKLIIIGAATVVLLVAGGGAGFVFLGGSGDPAEGDEVADAGEHGETMEHESSDDGEDAGHGEASEGDAPIVMGKMYELDTFVVNISDHDRDRYLKIKAEFELSDPSVSAELDQRIPHIRDLVISLLGSKSFEEIRSMEGKDLLREEILQRVNAMLSTGKARQIFFTEFVVQ
jgi:flagellar FliL protein